MSGTPVPSFLRSGDSWSWSVPADIASPYPGDTWDLVLALQSGTIRKTLSASWDGSAHNFSVEPAASALFAAGRWAWTLVAQQSSTVGDVETVTARETLDVGTLQILADPLAETPADERSHARRMLAAIEACLESRASEGDLDLVSTAVGGRQAQYSIADLRALYRQYAAAVAAEDAALARANGIAIGAVQMRFAG